MVDLVGVDPLATSIAAQMPPNNRLRQLLQTRVGLINTLHPTFAWVDPGSWAPAWALESCHYVYFEVWGACIAALGLLHAKCSALS